MVKGDTTSVCMRCGSSKLEDAILITYSAHTKLRIAPLKSPDDQRDVKGLLCLDCGFVEIYIDTDIVHLRAKKIAEELQGVFERFPKQRSISLENLRYRLWMSPRLILDVLDEVRQIYPHFRVVTENGKDLFVHEKR